MTEKVIELGNAEAIHKTSNLKQKGAYKKKKKNCGDDFKNNHTKGTIGTAPD